MTYYALTEIDSAIQRTRDLLWPFRKGVWLRLAVIALFVGFGGWFPQPTWSSDTEIFGDLAGFSAPTLPEEMLVILALILMVGLLGLLFWLIQSIIQFVFIDCIATKEISLTRTFGLRAGKGIRLLLFQAGLAILLLLLLGLLSLPILFAAGILSGPSIGFPIALLLLFMIPFFLLFVLFAALIQLITIDFVAPLMIRRDCGVLEGWRTFIRIQEGQWMQLIVYVLVRVLAALGTGIVILLLSLLVLAVIALPFIAIGLIGMMLLAAGNLVFLLLLAPYLIIAIPAVLMVSVPFVTFFRTYSLQVLGRLSPDDALLT